LGHVTLTELPEKRHKDGDFSLEDREGDELERERGVTEREETAIEALQRFYLTLSEAVEGCVPTLPKELSTIYFRNFSFPDFFSLDHSPKAQ